MRIANLLAALPFEQAVHDHLRYNLYPPAGEHASLAVGVCHAVAEDDGSRSMRMPDGTEIPAVVLAEGWGLQPFVDHLRAQS
jgi:hypothetical protein